MNTETERDESMTRLANWLRRRADEREAFPASADALRRWASEVEASRQRSAVGAEPVAWYDPVGDRVVTAAQMHSMLNHQGAPGKTAAKDYKVALTPPSERPAAPAQAGVTDAMKIAIEAMEDSLEDAQIAQGEYDGRTYNFCTSCGADDLQTPVIGKHNPRCAWTKVRAAIAALKSSLLAGTPPEQRDTTRPFGCLLAMRVLQSDLYKQLEDDERAQCDELVQRNLEWFKRDSAGIAGVATARCPVGECAMATRDGAKAGTCIKHGCWRERDGATNPNNALGVKEPKNG